MSEKKQSYCAGCSEAELKLFEPAIKKLISLANEEILPRFLAGTEVFDKKDHTPVTAADRGAEKVMREWIEAHFPTHGIFGEEFGIKEASGDSFPRYRWILDPIDGTRAFIHNAFHFGTLIAVERDDGNGFQPMLGVISHPHVGVWLIGDGERAILHGPDSKLRQVHCKETKNLADATLVVTSHWTTPEQKGGKEMQSLIDEVKLYRTCGDCFGYFSVATGGADIMIDPDLNYWDVAALVPVIEGSGARLVSMKGGNPLKDLSAVATNEYLLPEVLRKLAN